MTYGVPTPRHGLFLGRGTPVWRAWAEDIALGDVRGLTALLTLAVGVADIVTPLVRLQCWREERVRAVGR